MLERHKEVRFLYNLHTDKQKYFYSEIDSHLIMAPRHTPRPQHPTNIHSSQKNIMAILFFWSTYFYELYNQYQFQSFLKPLPKKYSFGFTFSDKIMSESNQMKTSFTKFLAWGLYIKTDWFNTAILIKKWL